MKMLSQRIGAVVNRQIVCNGRKHIAEAFKPVAPRIDVADMDAEGFCNLVWRETAFDPSADEVVSGGYHLQTFWPVRLWAKICFAVSSVKASCFDT